MIPVAPPDLIALTGASGLLGGAVARRLQDAGFRVRCLLRRPDPTLPGEAVIGDLADVAAIDRLVAGAAAVVHIAAMYRSDGPAEEFMAVNRDGTERLLRAAQAAGARRFVQCSTIGVHGSVPTSPADENAPFDPRDAYQESKLAAERICRAAVGTGPMEIVILRPCGIYGPGDTRLLKMFRMLQKRMFVQIGEGSANFHPVYIDDLAEGFMRGLTVPGIDGETFILGAAEYIPLKAFIAQAAASLDRAPPWIRLPYKPVERVADLCEAICRKLAIEPPLHRRRLTFFKHNRAFSIAHARERLGYEPQVDLAEGFRRTVAWYRQQGMLE
ncbi:Nucleoside-diphosphate-sugar epimerase [Sphingomonas sp. OV641]|uniref:NAD-dependent epimerase/dehydratase family protein n=1 Tax=Sphingomonas sp. OV641 TaxID=1881068 RepID=UPI0008C3793D|nr:NAD-dependent epimerase/dehydratase family protein [Sphingomonas sp. OV641]SEJ89140.1 Nucleoside-diphosphate-sugar epimerase [Sphingomonas sp. OV641]